jgi:diguanylate cyclase (GGDEF)-like protein
MKKSYLRWLLPLLIYLAALAMLLTAHSNTARKRAALGKQQEIILEISKGIKSVNENCGMSQAVVETSAAAMSLYALEYNRNQIIRLMQNIIAGSAVEDVIVCDLNGNGYDQHGDDVCIADEEYFDEVSREYSSGGIGMIFSGIGSEEQGTIFIVSSVTFDKRENGYIIASLPLAHYTDRLINTDFLAEKTALITIDGTVLMQRNGPKDSAEAGGVFWDQLPEGISKDTIKLSISQNVPYISEVPDYGYVVVAPLSTVNAGAVALVTKGQMDVMLRDDLYFDRVFTVEMSVMSIALIAMVFLSNFISDRIEQKIKAKREQELETDVLTGVLAKRSMIDETDKYIFSGKNKKGLMFIIYLSAVEKMKGDWGEAFMDTRIRDFARQLQSSFRSTDIIGRLSEDKFVIFLKDIYEDKDVRKQTDHMQLFLYDTQSEDLGENAYLCVGAALFPENGRSAVEVMAAAERALSRAKKEGKNRLSF